MIKYRLGIDIGATSIGWAVYNLDNQQILDMGVRIFDDGREDKSKVALCVKRRVSRGLRRLQNRKHIQKKTLLKTLITYNLFPTDRTVQQALKLRDPYELRAKALDNQLKPYEIGRVLFHLVQRKGFLSNRKDNKAEGGKLKQGYQQLLDEMEKQQARTYGEYLYRKKCANHNAELRLKNTFDAKGQFLGGLFPFRAVYKDEFQQIWTAQQAFYPDMLTEERRQRIEEILFF